jgi:hypothetical protein
LSPIMRSATPMEETTLDLCRKKRERRQNSRPGG